MTRLPHQVQGAGHFIEGGYKLAKCLNGVSRRSIADALLLYELIRKPRVTQAQLTSRAAGKIYSSDEDDANIQATHDDRWPWQ
jgi:2-polyprenyl-6-methoxyphenol hydroxylase-like FAD-dependent oxidoreductase